MLARITTLLLACISLTAPVQAGMWDHVKNFFYGSATSKPKTVKVLVLHDQPGAMLEVKGKYKIFDPNPKKTDDGQETFEHISTRFIGKRKYIQTPSGGLRWGEEFPGLHQLVIVPDDANTTTLVDGIEYPGSVYVYDIGGTISIVNELKLEDYLNSILTQQYPEAMNEEVLNAITIAARTTALYQIENPKTNFWTIDGKLANYQGSAAANPSKGVERAIKITRNMVLSQKAEGDNKIAPFIALWGPAQGAKGAPVIVSKINLAQADEMAQRGDNAAQILGKAFPNATIKLIP
jgi:stage II sporulation protein D